MSRPIFLDPISKLPKEIRPSDPIDDEVVPRQGPVQFYEYFQENHELTELTPVYRSESKWVPAKSNAINTLATYVVSKVIDSDTLVLVQLGRLDVPGHGLLLETIYYLSPVTAGLIVPVQPTSGFVQPILFAEDTTRLHLIPWGPITGAFQQVGVDKNIFNEILSVVSGIETDLVSFTVPVGKKFRFIGASAGGNGAGEFTFKLDGTPQSKQRSAWNDRDVDFTIRMEDIPASSVLKLTVLNSGNVNDLPQNYHGSLWGTLIDE